MEGPGWKVRDNSNLDNDSLCPHPVVSDTTSLVDCHVVHVGLEEPEANPETTKLKIFPNPASQKVTIELPPRLVVKASQEGIDITTVYHQWNQATLTVYSMTGRVLFSEEVSDKTDVITLDVSGWQKGVCVARLQFRNQPVADATFLVGD